MEQGEERQQQGGVGHVDLEAQGELAWQRCGQEEGVPAMAAGGP